MIQNIASVRGFKCWGAHSGIKSMRRDLAIIYSEVPAAAAATFTQNKVVAEPIKLSRRHIANGKAQVIVCNAGNANACTGDQGRDGAEKMAEMTAKMLKIDKEMVIVASTGLIGEPFPTDEIVKGIEENIPKLSGDTKAGSFTANAILTTDTFAKEGYLEFFADKKKVHLAGIAKGSGMIHPNMATMLAFIVTDLAIEADLLQETVNECVADTFNMITVDGDTSTNDMVAVLANGMAENKLIKTRKDSGFKAFETNLRKLMQHLAELIVSDGEGASKFIEYTVEGAKDKDTARKLARAISNSTLVKTAMFGRDPNWGRIISACGNAGVDFDYEKADLYLGDRNGQEQVLKNGQPIDFNRNYIKKLLRESHLSIRLVLPNGEGKATAWGTDLSTDYVLFNSVYTT